MNSFKHHFYQLVKEDPDSIDQLGLKWEDRDSKTFCLASKFLTYTLDEGTTHNALLFALQQEWAKTGNLLFRDEYVIKQKDGKKFVYQGDFQAFESLFEQERPFVRSDVLKLGKAQKWGLFMGRIWSDTQVVSFWNDLNDFKKNDLSKLKDFLVFHTNSDITQIRLEIVNGGQYQLYTWNEMLEHIKNKIKSTTINIGDKLHLTPPEKKGQMMKQMGIRPKINPNNIADRYKLNEESFYAFLEAQQIITEDYESTVTSIKNIIRNNDLPPESIDNILDVYNNVSVDDGRERAKKDSDLVALTYMYMVNNTDTVKQKYAAYLNSETSVNKKILSDYVTNLQNEIKSKGLFKPDKKAEKLALINTKTIELLGTIHRYRKKEEFTGTVPDENQDKVYEDKSIVVFKADSKAKCIYYGRNTNLCISTKSGNSYWKYRMGKMHDDGLGMTTYFVIPKDRVGNELIVIDAMGNELGSSNTFGYTIVEPSGKQVGDLYNISKDKLENKFPSLQKPFDNNIFEFIPYGEKEKRFQFIDEGIIGFDELKGYEDYEMYIQTDQFDSKNWNVIEKNVNDKDFRKLLLLASELEKNIPYNLIEKYFSEKEKERYIKNIAKNPEYSYNYAEDVLDKGQNVPDIILKSIAKKSEYSYGYANVLKGQNVPDIILKSIAKSSMYSYSYAVEVLKGQNVPDIIIQGIAKNLGYSCGYAVEVLKGQNVPDIILQSMAKNSWYSYNYAKGILNGQNVPDIILQSIAQNSEYSYQYAKDVLKGQNVPKIILQVISQDPGYSYDYAKFLSLKGQKVDDIILQRIAKDPKYAQKSLTEATLNSLSTIKSFKEYFYAFLEAQQIITEDYESTIKQISDATVTASKLNLTEAYINTLSKNIIVANAKNMEEIETRNFSPEYSADSYSLIRDASLEGFIGEGIFDDSNNLVGYGYGYQMGADGEYDDLEYIELDEITFFDKKFQQEIAEKGVKNICKPTNTFYFSNLVVDRQYRLYVKNLLISLINKITQHGYKFIVFDGLSDTIRLFDSLKKANRLSSLNLVKLAELDDDDSKLVVFYIK